MRKLYSPIYVKPYTIINISGNKYRLVILIVYTNRQIHVYKVMTHNEYDKWNKGGQK